MPPKGPKRKQRKQRTRPQGAPAAAAAPANIPVSTESLLKFQVRTTRNATAALAGLLPAVAADVLASLAVLAGRPIATYAPAVEGLSVAVLLAKREGEAFVRALAGLKQQGRCHELPAVPPGAARALADLCVRAHGGGGGAPLLLVPHVDSSTGGSRSRAWIEREVVPLLQHAGVPVAVVAALALKGPPRGVGVAGLAPFPVSRAAAQTAFKEARDRVDVPPGLVPPRAVVVVVDDSLNTGASLLGAVAELLANTAAASVQGVAIAANDIVRRGHRPVPLRLDGGFVAVPSPGATPAGAALHATIGALCEPATFEQTFDPTGCVAVALCASLTAAAPGLGAALAAGGPRASCLIEHLPESAAWAAGRGEGDTTQTYIRVDTAVVADAERAAADGGADGDVAQAIKEAIDLALFMVSAIAAVLYGGDTTGRIFERNMEHILSAQACDRTSQHLQRFNGGAATKVLHLFSFNQVVGVAVDCGVSVAVAKGVAECIAWRLLDRAGCTNKAATGYGQGLRGCRLAEAPAGPVAVLSRQLQSQWPGMTRDAARALVKAHVSLAALLKDAPDVALLAAQRVACLKDSPDVSVGVGWSILCAQDGTLGAPKAWVRFVDGILVLCSKGDDGAVKISSPAVHKLKGVKGAPMAWVRRDDAGDLVLCSEGDDGATLISSPAVHTLKGVKGAPMAWVRRDAAGDFVQCSEADDGATLVSSPAVHTLKGIKGVPRAWVRRDAAGVLTLCSEGDDGAALVSSPGIPSLKGAKGAQTRWVFVDALGKPTGIAEPEEPGAVLMTHASISSLRNRSKLLACEYPTVSCDACGGPAAVVLKAGHASFEAWHLCEGSDAQLRTNMPTSSPASVLCMAIAVAAGQVVDNWDSGVKEAVAALNRLRCLGCMPCKVCKADVRIRLQARDESFVAAHACPDAGYRPDGKTGTHNSIATSVVRDSEQYELLKVLARSKGVVLARGA